MRKQIIYPVVAITIVLVISFGFRSDKKMKTTVKIETGIVKGTENESGEINIFKGIPFAAPPLGELRWKAPQPVQPWKDTLNCTAYSPSPMQVSPEPFRCWSEEFLIPKEPISEDCLYLNIWTGAEKIEEKRPVLVYIYGGAFKHGGSACPIYDGEAMAEKGVVFVTFNYRLGIFGFFAHPELSEEAEYNSSGNYALLDMIEALRWIQKNISVFGGDPNNVTIAGQSAGAVAVNYLTSSQLAKGLFHKAIAESGATFYSNSAWEKSSKLESAEKRGLELTKSINCNTISDLRTKSAEELLEFNNDFSSPIVDGYLVTSTNLENYKSGKQHDVPLLIGWNKDDLEGGFISKSDFQTNINNRFGKLSGEFLAEYPAISDDEATKSLAFMIRDEYFGFQTYTWAKLHTQTGNANVFVYNFNRGLPVYSSETAFGAFHSGEIVYAYNNLHKLNRPWTEIDQQLADQMSDYWVNFASTGNPNGGNLPRWEGFNLKDEKVILFDEVVESKNLPTKSKMLLWKKYYSSQ
ncbi:MAG: carboxylesterase family protein [Melioribacteraceae bacterium]|nr:carboxylesterase family protein [Melioribacteraceae bacterium]MCF8263898.1 carboxylesterase family protein [Melioribacteraceae bacterium]MCF8430303.1 carboxylesterase family protein [Melioribacteraceae bacterium]